MFARAKPAPTPQPAVAQAENDSGHESLIFLNKHGLAHTPNNYALAWKSVNDRFGHGVGDRVLKAVAASLSESVAPSTVVRWGGEEFLIILDGIGMKAASAILERARRDIETRSFRLRSSEEPIGTVTISIGAAPLAACKQGECIESADRMLYEAKRAGRNRIEIFPERQS